MMMRTRVSIAFVYFTRSMNNIQKSLFGFSLATILVIVSTSFLVQVNTLENVDAVIIDNPSAGSGLIVNEASSGFKEAVDTSLGLNLVEGGGENALFLPTNPTAPTFNPMFSKCVNDDIKTGKEINSLYKWEASKNAITAKLGDRKKLNSKDFSFDIFADLVKDDAKFDSKDYPYKADFKTKRDGQTSVNIKEFATVCIDLVDLELPQATIIDLGKSEALEELGFDS